MLPVWDRLSTRQVDRSTRQGIPPVVVTIDDVTTWPDLLNTVTGLSPRWGPDHPAWSAEHNVHVFDLGDTGLIGVVAANIMPFFWLDNNVKQVVHTMDGLWEVVHLRRVGRFVVGAVGK